MKITQENPNRYIFRDLSSISATIFMIVFILLILSIKIIFLPTFLRIFFTMIIFLFCPGFIIYNMISSIKEISLLEKIFLVSISNFFILIFGTLIFNRLFLFKIEKNMGALFIIIFGLVVLFIFIIYKLLKNLKYHAQ